jgi:hypothetical protein
MTQDTTRLVEEIDGTITRMLADVDRLRRARDILDPPAPQQTPKRRSARKPQARANKRMPLAEREAQIKALLDERKTLDTREVAGLLGVSGGYAVTVMRGLADRGEITVVKPSAGRDPAIYSLPSILNDLRANGAQTHQPVLS